MVIVTRLTADPDFEKNNAFRGATTQSWGLPEGLGIPDFRDGNGISISTDYYHGLLRTNDMVFVHWGSGKGGGSSCADVGLVALNAGATDNRKTATFTNQSD